MASEEEDEVLEFRDLVDWVLELFCMVFHFLIFLNRWWGWYLEKGVGGRV
jgi:hypothetical protein